MKTEIDKVLDALDEVRADYYKALDDARAKAHAKAHAALDKARAAFDKALDEVRDEARAAKTKKIK